MHVKIQTYIPHLALQEFIACMFIAENRSEGGEENVFSPFPPNPQNSIIFYIRDAPLIHRGHIERATSIPPCIFVAQHTERINSKMGKDHLMVYVGFKPGGLYRLLGIPMNKLINEPTDGKDLYGNEISLILEQLNEATSWTGIIKVVEEFLLSKLKGLRPMEPFDQAIEQLVREHGNMSMDYIAGLSCLSFRQFERKCKDKIGVPPKLYARIARFSKAYRMKEINSSLSWTNLAHSSGYFDQMHLIRDFKEFTGVTPTMMDHVLKHTIHKMQTDLVI